MPLSLESKSNPVGAWRDIVAYAFAASLLVALVRHGLRVGSVDDMRAISLYAAGSDVHSIILQPLYNWGRWLTVFVLTTMSHLGVPAYIANKFSYPLYEGMLALMNTLFAFSIMRRKSWEVAGFIVFLGLSDTWLVLANFDIVGVSLVSCFAITSIYIYFREHQAVQRFILPVCTIGICASYQGFLYVFIAIVTALTISESIRRSEAYPALIHRLLVAAASVIFGALAYFAISKGLYFMFDMPGGNIKFNAGNIGETLVKNLRGGAANSLYRDWLVHSNAGFLNWRHASYALLFTLSAILLVRNRGDRISNLVACCIIPVVFFFVIMAQPLQLFSGHGGVPYRAFAYTNYILCGAVMLNLIALSKGGHGAFPRRLAGGMFVLMSAVMLFQTSAIVHSFELTRSRDVNIVRGLEEFYNSNNIPLDAPLAIALSRSADDPLVAYAGEHRIDALLSAMRMPWSYLPFTHLNSLIRPSPPTKQQSADAWTGCAKYGRDGFNVKYEYHPPVVVICY